MPQNTMKQRLNSISQLATILVARRKAMRMSQQALAAKLAIGQAGVFSERNSPISRHYVNCL